VVKEKDKAEKARESIPKQVLLNVIVLSCLAPCVSCAVCMTDVCMQRMYATQEKAIAEAEATTAKMEKLIPTENQVLDKMYEATKEETDGLRAKLDKAQEELLPWTKMSNEAQSNCDLVKGEIELVMSKATKAKQALANAQQLLKDAEPKRKEKQKALKEKQTAVCFLRGLAPRSLLSFTCEHVI
jgi:hypothetical protein